MQPLARLSGVAPPVPALLLAVLGAMPVLGQGRPSRPRVEIDADAALLVRDGPSGALGAVLCAPSGSPGTALPPTGSDAGLVPLVLDGRGGARATLGPVWREAALAGVPLVAQAVVADPAARGGFALGEAALAAQSPTDRSSTHRPSSSPISADGSRLRLRLAAGESATVHLRAGESSVLLQAFEPLDEERRIELALPPPLGVGAPSLPRSDVELRVRSGWIVELAGVESRGARALSLGRLVPTLAEKEALDDAFAESRAALESELRALAPGYRVAREFRTVLAGLEIRGVPETVLQDLEARGFLTRYEPNLRVYATLEDSVPATGAPAVWSSGFTGAGIRIGVLDTGVDYTHPDLGGCTSLEYAAGQCPKVLPGYDFIDDDADPYDDCHGHGTHVASIAASGGPTPGVAPSAAIVPIRVLGCSGFGTWSAVIAGIEFAIDPDGDGDLSDQLDVINLSLGGYGQPDSLAALALDVASDLGVVPVVAAGNAGAGFPDVVQSPGTSLEAITVGAVDSDLDVADFSSAGPVYWVSGGEQLAIGKPDLAAPGVDICAAGLLGSDLGPQCGGDAYEMLSGTSMATPHVAGVAALLREGQPDWTPAQVKSALMNGAQPVESHPMQVGSGFLDAPEAFFQLEPLVVQLEEVVYSDRFVAIRAETDSPDRVLGLRVEIAPIAGLASGQSTWSLVAERLGFPPDGLLAEIDSFQVAEGDHVVRVTFSTPEGRRVRRSTGFRVDYFGTPAPVASDLHNVDQPIHTALGYDEELSIESFSVEHRPRGMERWSDAGVGSLSARNDRLAATIAAHTFAKAGLYELRFSLVHDGGIEKELLTAFGVDPALAPGFPVALPPVPAEVVLAVGTGLEHLNAGDVVPGGGEELVVLRGGTPPEAIVLTSAGQIIHHFPFGSSGFAANPNHSPALADFDGDGLDEIALIYVEGPGPYPPTIDSELFATVVRADGTPLPGWPRLVDVAAGDFGLGLGLPYGQPMAGDVDADGRPELVVSYGYGTRFAVIDAQANLMSQQVVGDFDCTVGPLTFVYVNSRPSHVVLGDVDGDCIPEVVGLGSSLACDLEEYESQKTLSVFDAATGSLESSWPVGPPFLDTNAGTRLDPLVLDLNGDGLTEIAAVLEDHGLSVFDAHGSTLFEEPLSEASLHSLVPFDPEGDGVWSLVVTGSDTGTTLFDGGGARPPLSIDLPVSGPAYASVASLAPEGPALVITDTAAELVGAYDARGVSLDHFPKGPFPTTFNAPTLRDVDDDGHLELIATGARWTADGRQLFVYMWETASPVVGRSQQWPQYRYSKSLAGDVGADFGAPCR